MEFFKKNWLWFVSLGLLAFWYYRRYISAAPGSTPDSGPVVTQDPTITTFALDVNPNFPLGTATYEMQGPGAQIQGVHGSPNAAVTGQTTKLNQLSPDGKTRFVILDIVTQYGDQITAMISQFLVFDVAENEPTAYTVTNSTKAIVLDWMAKTETNAK